MSTTTQNKVRLSTAKGVQSIFIGKEKVGEIDYPGLGGRVTFRFEPARFSRTPSNLHILAVLANGDYFTRIELGRF